MHRTQVILNHTLEKTVARQAADLSLLAEERFRQEFESLALAAELLAASPNKIEEERIFYKVRVQVELDPANPYFYMKDGQLYKKDSDENYSDFYNPLKEKKDAGGEPTDK